MIVETEKSTHDYISEAYQEALDAIQSLKKRMETPSDIAEMEAAAEKEKQAEHVLSLNILNEDVTSEYRDLERRIADKRSKLEKLYGITICSDSLQAVSDASQTLEESFKTAYEKSETDFATKLSDQEKEAELKSAELETETAKRTEELTSQIKSLQNSYKQEVEREQSEYEYRLERERKSEKERRQEQIRLRELELTKKESSAGLERDTIQKRMEEISDLRDTVNGIADRIEQARILGAKKAEKEMNKAFNYKRALEDKDHENKLAALEARYERLLSKYQALEKERDSIAEKLDRCNAESRALTSDTVRSIGGINILNSEPRSYSGGAVNS